MRLINNSNDIAEIPHRVPNSLTHYIHYTNYLPIQFYPQMGISKSKVDILPLGSIYQLEVPNNTTLTNPP